MAVSFIEVITDAVRENSRESYDKIKDLVGRIVAFDCETWLIQPGLLCPPLVCASISWVEYGEIRTELLSKAQARERFRAILDDPDVIVTGANISYDMGVMAADAHRQGEDLLPKIFAMYEAGRVYDVQLAQQLHAIAQGTLGRDEHTGAKIKGGGRYSLATCVQQVLGRDDAKRFDKWRLRYAELDDVPLDQWPADALTYPLDDARNTLEVTLAQLGTTPKICRHDWGKHGCNHCGSTTLASNCSRCEPHRNLHSLADQVYTAFALHLGAAWGFRVDQNRVRVLKEAIRAKRAALEPQLKELGFLRADGTKCTRAIALRVARAYGTVGICGNCEGEGRVVSAAGAKRKSPCRTCNVRPIEGRPGCEVCGVGCKSCSGTGLDLATAPDLPLTDKDQVSAGRDVLDESGDEDLMLLSAYGRLAKGEEVYCPYLEKAGDRPLNLRPNALVETDRTSYGDVIQQFPRGGIVGPDDKIIGFRECIVARPGMVLSSTDYSFGELITHAQSCLWLLDGHSDLAEALLAGKEPHKALGAQMLGLTFEDFCSRMDDKSSPSYKACKDARQAAKPANFGFPGGMGAPKLALQQRRAGPDTPCPLGPAILDEKKRTRGYRGLRFCILMDGAERCGIQKLNEWKGRECAPTCAHCLECAERLRDEWFAKWQEMRPYFALVSHFIERGQEYGCGPGELIQHDSRIIRQVCNTFATREQDRGGFTNGANGYFQSLLARAAKRANRWIQRECCDETYRISREAPGLKLGAPSPYAGLESPLLGSRAIVFQHDENICEHPRDVAHDATIRVSELMVQSLRLACPDMAPVVKAPPAMMPAWLKSAEPLFHLVNGRKELVEWTPEHADPATCPDCQECFAA